MNVFFLVHKEITNSVVFVTYQQLFLNLLILIFMQIWRGRFCPPFNTDAPKFFHHSWLFSNFFRTFFDDILFILDLVRLPFVVRTLPPVCWKNCWGLLKRQNWRGHWRIWKSLGSMLYSCPLQRKEGWQICLFIGAR